ncbi:hypothetical protein V2I01_30995 [Micromonospora sp. BRA006-A]|nr:hypothetical protein [Micromonospora sp. BRA006-A]
MVTARRRAGGLAVQFSARAPSAPAPAASCTTRSPSSRRPSTRSARPWTTSCRSR